MRQAGRSDAKRNLERLLQAAREAFAASGVDVPVRDIAVRAGLGIATMYRHFPTRADLIAAVFRNEVDACAEAGAELATTNDDGNALFEWVDRYVEFIATRRGLAAALNSEEPAFQALPQYFLQSLRPMLQNLLDAAIAAGKVRDDITPDELLFAVAGLCTPPSCSEPPDARRMVSLFLDGLRYGASAKAVNVGR